MSSEVNSNTIQELVDSVIPGGAVRLPATRIHIARPILIRSSNVRIIGSGVGGTRLVMDSNFEGLPGYKKCAIVAANARDTVNDIDRESKRNVILKDFSIEVHGLEDACGIDASGLSYSEIKRVSISIRESTIGGVGIYAKGHPAGRAPLHNVIDKFTMTGSSRPRTSGIHFDACGEDLRPAFGPNHTNVLNGRIAACDVGIKVTAGNGCSFVGVCLESIMRRHFEFGFESKDDWGRVTREALCSANNIVTGGYSEGSSRHRPSYVGFGFGATNNYMRTGHITGLRTVDELVEFDVRGNNAVDYGPDRLTPRS